MIFSAEESIQQPILMYHMNNKVIKKNVLININNVFITKFINTMVKCINKRVIFIDHRDMSDFTSDQLSKRNG